MVAMDYGLRHESEPSSGQVSPGRTSIGLKSRPPPAAPAAKTVPESAGAKNARSTRTSHKAMKEIAKLKRRIQTIRAQLSACRREHQKAQKSLTATKHLLDAQEKRWQESTWDFEGLERKVMAGEAALADCQTRRQQAEHDLAGAIEMLDAEEDRRKASEREGMISRARVEILEETVDELTIQVREQLIEIEEREEEVREARRIIRNDRKGRAEWEL